MLIHEFNFLSPNILALGWDELVDTTSLGGYTFYGLAQASAVGVWPDTTKAVWFIFAVNTTTQKTRYYPPNQIWANRASLTLP